MHFWKFNVKTPITVDRFILRELIEEGRFFFFFYFKEEKIRLRNEAVRGSRFSDNRTR